MKFKLPKMKFNLSLRIASAMAIVIVLVVVAIGVVSISYSTNMLIKAEEESIANLAKSGADRVKVLTGETVGLGERDYIKKALSGEPNVSNVIISKVTNSAVLMYAVPINRDGVVVGALIGRRDGAALNAKQTENGAMTTNTLGQIIAKNQDYLNELNASINLVNTLSDTGLVAVQDLNNKWYT